MCGICGIYDLSAPAYLLPDVHRMSQIVQHRGPDDSGWVAICRSGEVMSKQQGFDVGTGDITSHSDFVLGLGHRRLSIIDLSRAGHQPMSDASGRYWIVYNGEVYNYIELRGELVARGREFQSHTGPSVPG